MGLRKLQYLGDDLRLGLGGEEVEAAVERLLDDESAGVVRDVVDAGDVLVVVGREDLLGLGVALVEGVGVRAEQHRNPLLRPVVLVAEPHLGREKHLPGPKSKVASQS